MHAVADLCGKAVAAGVADGTPNAGRIRSLINIMKSSGEKNRAAGIGAKSRRFDIGKEACVVGVNATVFGSEVETQVGALFDVIEIHRSKSSCRRRVVLAVAHAKAIASNGLVESGCRAFADPRSQVLQASDGACRLAGVRRNGIVQLGDQADVLFVAPGRAAVGGDEQPAIVAKK